MRLTAAARARRTRLSCCFRLRDVPKSRRNDRLRWVRLQPQRLARSRAVSWRNSASGTWFINAFRRGREESTVVGNGTLWVSSRARLKALMNQVPEAEFLQLT